MNPAARRRWLIIPILLVGGGAFFGLLHNRTEPVRVDLGEATTVVRTIAVPALTVVPRYVGNGNVAPAHVWNGVAQVAGKVTRIDPMFKKGAVVETDQFLLQIDPSDYELAIREAETAIEAARAQLSEIDVQEANSNASLNIEKDALKISMAEVARKRSLAERGTVSSSEYEKEQRSVLTQRAAVQSLQNRLRLYPAERRRLEAELARLEIQLRVARLDLGRTRVAIPFTARVASADVQLYEFVRVGDRLGVADAIDRAEIEVQVPMWRVAALLQSEGVTEVQIAQTPNLGERFGLQARVLLERGGLEASWDGRVSRFSDALDPRTRTVGVIVEVDEPYANVRPGVRPPLLKGMFVTVEISGRALPDVVVIPRTALHGEEVYVVGPEQRLLRRAVRTGHAGPGFHVIREGLAAGERLVISDLLPAIDGMALEPVDDPDTLDRLTRAAGGDAPAP